MTTIPYTAPSAEVIAFNCPHCLAFSHVQWGRVVMHLLSGTPTKVTAWHGSEGCEHYWTAKCYHCKQISIWHDGRMVYPDLIGGIEANSDMPDDIKRDFDEARGVVNRSPRGAAALLRLCIEKVCEHLLGNKHGDINADIAQLVKDGLPVTVQRALDTVRVIGNECVHAGQIDYRDNAEIATKLFGLVNFVVDDRITRPREIAAMYATLAPGKLEAIEKRDGKA
jgi:hypothetical protein